MSKDRVTRGTSPLSADDIAEIKRRRAEACARLKATPRDEVEPAAIDPDNPPMSDEELSRLQPAHEARPMLVAAQLKRERGRPTSERRKLLISIRLDPDVVERLRASGEGWQSRVNDTLRKSLGL